MPVAIILSPSVCSRVPTEAKREAAVVTYESIVKERVMMAHEFTF